MSPTHDMIIDNSTGANVRADINNALAALVSNSSSSSEPATKYAYMWWVDTTANIVKIRNSSNNAWINLFTTSGGIDVDAASNFNEDVTFTGASANIVFDKSDNQLEFADNAKAEFGTGGDLEIFHNGTASLIKSPSHTLFIQATTIDIGNGAGNEAKAKLIDDGAVELYFDNSKKLETQSAGVEISGKLTFATEGLANGSIDLGIDADLNLYHDNSDAFMDNNTGDFYIRNSGGNPNQIYIQGKGGENGIIVNGNGAVELYHDNDKVFETLAAGFKVGRTSSTNSYIEIVTSGGTAGFLYGANNNEMRVMDREGHTFLKGIKDGAVELFYDDSKKIETISTGIETAEIIKMRHGSNGVNVRQVEYAGIGNTASHTFTTQNCHGGGTVTVVSMNNGNGNISTTRMFPIHINSNGTSTLGSEIFTVHGATSGSSFSTAAAAQGITVTNGGGSFCQFRVTFDITANV